MGRLPGTLPEDKWDSLPVQLVSLDQLVWMLDGINIAHVWPDGTEPVSEGPIRVARLNTGQYLVRDGRHRVIRAILSRKNTIEARIHPNA